MLKNSDLALLEKQNTDYKSRLIIYCQKQKLKLQFKLIEEALSGDKKLFTMGVFIDDQLKDKASGLSKRAAERQVAKQVILGL